MAALPADLVDVAYRMVHASGMTDLVADLAFTADVAEKARAALAAAAHILADCQMVASGISRRSAWCAPPPRGRRATR